MSSGAQMFFCFFFVFFVGGGGGGVTAYASLKPSAYCTVLLDAQVDRLSTPLACDGYFFLYTAYTT